MTHDPLCPFFYDQIGRELVRQTGNPCTYCDLIARVREDERTNEPPAWAYANGYDTALQDAIDAVNKFVNNPEDDWDKAINNRFIQEIVNAISRAHSTRIFEGEQ